MNLSYLFSSALVLLLAACSSDADHFTGAWQSVNDPSKQIIINGSGKAFTLETRNIEPAVQGIPGTYDAEGKALAFVLGDGDTTTLVYDEQSQKLSGLGDTFEKSTNAVAETKEEKGPEEKPAEPTPAENTQVSDNSTNCGKGDVLMITGNNVRVRNEPDLTKQNILFQVHKNYEVIHLDDKTVDGQKWYKVCYDGNIGWVSGQYAAKK